MMANSRMYLSGTTKEFVGNRKRIHAACDGTKIGIGITFRYVKQLLRYKGGEQSVIYAGSNQPRWLHVEKHCSAQRVDRPLSDGGQAQRPTALAELVQ